MLSVIRKANDPDSQLCKVGPSQWSIKLAFCLAHSLSSDHSSGKLFLSILLVLKEETPACFEESTLTKLLEEQKPGALT